jgi:fumarylacetoacetase
VHLRETESWSLGVRLELAINGHAISRPDFASMYWSAEQQMAHMTSNGSSLRTGDIYGSGTISSFGREGQGSLLELSRDGTERIKIPGGTRAGYLEDGDIVTVHAAADTPAGQLSFGEAVGLVMPAAPRLPSPRPLARRGAKSS